MATARASTPVCSTKVYSFVGVGQQLVMGKSAFKTVTVFRFTCASFQRTQATEFAFND
jgi:hypothetical protein